MTNLIIFNLKEFRRTFYPDSVYSNWIHIQFDFEEPAMESELRQRREALSYAVNARDVAAMREFVTSTYRGTRVQGTTYDKETAFNALANIAAWPSRYQEKIAIRGISINGDVAELHTIRYSQHLLLWPIWRQRETYIREIWTHRDGLWMLSEEMEIEERGRLCVSFHS